MRVEYNLVYTVPDIQLCTLTIPVDLKWLEMTKVWVALLLCCYPSQVSQKGFFACLPLHVRAVLPPPHCTIVFIILLHYLYSQLKLTVILHGTITEGNKLDTWKESLLSVSLYKRHAAILETLKKWGSWKMRNMIGIIQVFMELLKTMNFKNKLVQKVTIPQY